MDKYVEANITFSMFCKNYFELKKDLPIRPSELAVLNILTLREGPFTPLMIADLMNVSKPMITAHIRVLEKNGYIYKEVSKEDKRSFFVKPTKKAEELVKGAAERTKATLKQLEASLGDEKFQNLLCLLREANEWAKG